MHDGMPYDPFQGQGHECLKATRGVDCQSRMGLVFFQYYAKRLAGKNVSEMTHFCVQWDVKP